MGKVYQMPHIVNTGRLDADEFVSSFDVTEWPASSATEIDEQTYYPRAETVTWWKRVLRRVRAWRINRMKP